MRPRSYNLGFGVQQRAKELPQNDVEAVKWYRKAAEQGLCGRATQPWFQRTPTGKGDCRQNNIEAVKWYRLAAEQGFANAQGTLGWKYANGDGVPEDDVEAVKWYRLAAEQGDVDAQNNLAIMYAKGEGVPQDDVEAYVWLSVAATNGHESAKKELPKAKAKLTPEQLIAAQKRATALFEQIDANKVK